MHRSLYTNMYQQLNVDFDDDYGNVGSWTQSAVLTVSQKQETLFYSVCWTLTTFIDGEAFIESKSYDEKRSDQFIDRWMRQLIRQYRHDLVNRHVNIETAYEQFGGDYQADFQ